MRCLIGDHLLEEVEINAKSEIYLGTPVIKGKTIFNWTPFNSAVEKYVKYRMQKAGFGPRITFELFINGER